MKALSPKQIAVAQLLVSGMSGITACAQVGIDPATLSRWKQQSLFRIYVFQLLKEIEEESIQGLQALKAKAAQRIGELMENPNPYVSLKAAESILDRAGSPSGDGLLSLMGGTSLGAWHKFPDN